MCGTETLFEQSTRTCQTASQVDCSVSESFYHLNEPSNAGKKKSLNNQHLIQVRFLINSNFKIIEDAELDDYQAARLRTRIPIGRY